MAVIRAAGALALATALAVAACTDAALTIQPVVDVPADEDDATASMLDAISLTVAHARSDRDLVTQNFRSGQPLEMPGVPFGDDLVLHMSGFVDQSSVAYGRTCVISVGPDRPPPTPHLFFSRSVKFASLDIRPQLRIGGLGVSYLGTALLIDGNDGTRAVQSVERFDPVTGELHMVGPVVARDRGVQALVGTSPPRALVIGGSSDGIGVGLIEVLDDHGIDRVEIDSMARIDLTATALTDGRVMVIGGRPPPAGPPVGDIYEVAENGPTLEARKLTEALDIPRSGHTAIRLGEDVGAPVLIAGGSDAMGVPVGPAELFKPLSEELSKTFSFAMKIPRTGHTAALMPDGSVLFIGGFDAMGQPVKTLELFSVDSGFTLAGPLPDRAGVVEFAATTLPDGRILLTGGRETVGGPALDTAFIIRLNPLDGMVDIVATDRMAFARAGHQALLLCDGTVLVTGGTAASFTAERYNPPSNGRR